ncbi:MAG TPA: curli-like amyloid fiber formation chaperone CsgH [Devosia sp.]|nr:curli-like amyloid fiber formation chaperone CsgH [Devosia sp.]
MTNGKQFSICAALIVAGLGAAFSAASASQAGSQPVQCEIATKKSSGGMTVIEGLVHAPKAISGTYRMKISGPGTNISQGGDFDASAGKPAVLSSIMLSGSGQRISLDVTADGHTASCSKRL